LLDADCYPYDGSTVPDRASVIKSFMTSLIGIAADQGRLDLNAPLLSFFADRKIASRDPRKERITVRHLASMSAGMACSHMPDEPTHRAMHASAKLFEPTDSRTGQWAADPQGISNGHGELYWHHCDAAKLGFLWLHGGRLRRPTG
jgi:CubicO group peptidase (beta-lactamase class C family)